MIKQYTVTEITMPCITTPGRSYAYEPVKSKRSLRPARTQLSTLSYTVEISKKPNQLSVIQGGTSSLYRERLREEIRSTNCIHPAKLASQARNR